ncbi:MAG TPA: helix-turn-helix domain-containing protein [Kineosporiaceae bacterium]|nr:helix-turn-helix domain-containing protein [Kineosporiaceae bacterium]
MPRDEIQLAVDRLADRLQRSVVVNDPGVHLLYASPHYGDEDAVRIRSVLQREADGKVIGHVLAQGVSTWTTAGVIPPNPELEMKARVCVPVRWRGELLGLLIVMDADASLTTSELGVITDAATGLAPLLEARLRPDVDEQAASAREQAVLDLLAPEPLLRRRALAELGGGSGPPGNDAVAVVEVGLRGVVTGTSSGHVETALRQALAPRRTRSPESVPALHAVRAGIGVLVVRGGSAEHLVRTADRMVATVRDLSAGRFDAAAGIGSTVPGLDRAFESAAQAGLARRAAGTVLDVAVATWEQLGPYGVVLRIPDEELTCAALPAELRRVLAVDRDGELTRTLRAYLDAAGNGPAAADTLHIHRTTLYYRLRRVAQLTGLDLDDGRTRLALHLGLTLLDVLETRPSPVPRRPSV